MAGLFPVTVMKVWEERCQAYFSKMLSAFLSAACQGKTVPGFVAKDKSKIDKFFKWFV